MNLWTFYVVGIFPTSQQHKSVFKDFLKIFMGEFNRDRLDYINNLINNESYSFNDLLNIINHLDNYQQKYILDLYKKLGFSSNRRIFYFGGIEIIGNFDNFKSKISHVDDESKKLWDEEEEDFTGKEYNISPNIFHMGEMFINSFDNKKTLNFINKNGISKYNIQNGILIDVGFPNGIIKSTKVGWNTLQLRKALSDVGIFDTKVEDNNITALVQYWDDEEVYNEKKGKYVIKCTKNHFKKLKVYKHIYPNLQKYGIPFVYYNCSKIPGYDMYNLNKSMLENLYRLIFKPHPNWKEVCSTYDIDGPSILIEYERRTGKKLPTDNKNIICSILNQKNLFYEIPELSQQIILQPPSKTAAGVQYLKYLEDLELSNYSVDKKFINPKREISMLDYQIFYDICRDPNKDRFVALLYANRLGLDFNINENSTKEEICTVITNHLKLIKEGRKL